jgi:hypothetical protein
MKTRTIGNLTLIIDPPEQETTDWIDTTCQRAFPLIRASWGLVPPEDCRIYVMTSWPGFVSQSAPWPWKILLGATLPFWAFRARRTWPISAAWTQRYGRSIAIGVKPPRLLQMSNREIGVRISVEERDVRVNIQQVTCHELAHACSAHLKLPMWLNEGIAILTVDRFLERPTIREETLTMLRDFSPKIPPPTYRELSRMGLERIAYECVRGYWLVRYVEEQQPDLLRRLFSSLQNPAAIHRMIAAALGVRPDDFWKVIDGMVVEHFLSMRAGFSSATM